MHVYHMCMHTSLNFQFYWENKLENKVDNSLVEDEEHST